MAAKRKTLRAPAGAKPATRSKSSARRSTASAPSRSSSASGRMTGALRSTAAVRGRHADAADDALEAGRTASAARGAVGRLGDGERDRSDEPEHASSGTAVAAEALRSGVVPNAAPRHPDDDAIPGEGERIRAGDPETEALRNEYVGEETPGGSTPTPDQGNVDDIGRAYGVQEEDSGELRTSGELMAGRDQRRRGFGVKRRQS